uniref:Uncharacterized protein n=1 Tax=Glossina brevipalpis TaxID=37001 RepID=A0A1A9W4G7_9MUSC
MNQQSQSTENLLTASKKPKVPPPILPKPKVKTADLMRNFALDSFQNTDVGHGDFAVFEHDPNTNTIHEISKQNTSSSTATVSPKLPVRVKMPRSPVRPRESPPPPPINYATMPKALPTTSISGLQEGPEYLEVLPPLPATPSLRTTHTVEEIPPSQRRRSDFIHENSPDNILVSEDEHRNILLKENQLRNQLRKPSSKSTYTQLTSEMGAPKEPAPPIPGKSVKDSMSPSDMETVTMTRTKLPKSVSDKKRFFESAMEEQHKPAQKAEKVFSFLSKDEIEKLRQEEERKIATLCRDKESRLFDGTNNEITDRQTSDDENNYVRQSIVNDADDDDDNDENDDDDNAAVDDVGYVNEDVLDVRQRKHNGSYNDSERVAAEEDGNIINSTNVQVLRETYIDHQCTGDETEDIR